MPLAGLIVTLSSFSPLQGADAQVQAVSAPGEAQVAAAAAAQAAASVKLPYGVEDVLKLSRANIGESIIINYINNSGTIYNLQPTDIVYLRDQGVSETVINRMIDQKKVVSEAAPQNGQQPAEGQQAPQPIAAQAPAPVFNPMPAPEPAPSTLYVIPYPAATKAYHSQYRPLQVRAWGSVYSGGYFGYRYGCGSSVVTIHSGFGGHTPHYRAR
jgi:hypothetical protein